jgi:hypothetical protein
MLPLIAEAKAAVHRLLLQQQGMIRVHLLAQGQVARAAVAPMAMVAMAL